MNNNLLEEALGEDTVVYCSVQNAVQACMELLGSRTHEIVAVIPVTTPIEVLSGIMRSGSLPIILDLDEDTLQIAHSQLCEVLEELKEGVVMVLPRRLGKDLQEPLRGVIKDYPLIVINEFTPMPQDQHSGDFNIYPLEPWVGCGAVIRSKFDEQIADLKVIRSGALGLGAELPDSLVLKARDSMDKAVPVKRELQLLHQVPEVMSRWMEEPEYPVAEALLRGEYNVKTSS